MGYSPGGRKESDMTERLHYTSFTLLTDEYDSVIFFKLSVPHSLLFLEISLEYLK